MSNKPERFCRKKYTFIMLLATLLALPCLSIAADDEAPFFAGGTGSPNVMILFDNSDSMQDSPYFRKDGNTYRPSTYWRRGVTIENDYIAEDGSGNIIYDQAKWITTDTVLSLPGQNPPNLPGLLVPSSTVTSFQPSSSCPAPNDTLTCSSRIYDSNVDWSLVDWSAMAYTYRYWQVKITDQDTGDFEMFSLYDRNTTYGYWTVSSGPIQYNTDHIYKYEIVAGSPGEVTYNQSNASRVYDRRFDWSTVSVWADWNASYRYKKIEVYAGTNAGEQRTLTGRHTSYGYWEVDSAFSVPCDDTSKYRILGEADDNKYAQGGNHPDSKMYQAKQALKKFLTSESIITTDTAGDGSTSERYLMNVGFATFLQARSPRTRAQYYRKRGVFHPAQFRYLYRANYSTSATAYNPTGCTGDPLVPPTSATFTNTQNWTQTYTDIPEGGTVDRLYQSGTCSEQTIRYQVTYSCSPTDALPNRVQINLQSSNSWSDPSLAGVDPEGNPQWGYAWIGWRNFNDNGTGDCTTYSPPNPYNGNNYLINPGETCYQSCQNINEWTENPYYETTWKQVWGNLSVADSADPGYIEKNPAPDAKYIVTPYYGNCAIPGDDWLCTNPDPEDIGDGYGDWTLVTPARALTLVDVPINNSGTIGSIASEIFDYSDFSYPGRIDDVDHPNGWSYKETADDYIYSNAYNALSTWPDSAQPDPFFPAVTAEEFTNYQGNDQVVFVNLPEYTDLLGNKGDDYSGVNITKVLNYIDLTRAEYPSDRRYMHTMAPISKGALAVNYRSDQTGVGTPLGATLADARKYFQSYMEQDGFDGCRDSYIILLTDGTETAGGDPVAEALSLQNMIVNGELRKVKVYVIGFGLDEASKATLNAIAAAGGSTNAYFANNVDQLVTILAHDIASDILSGSYGRTKLVLTPGGLDTGDGLTVYNAYFDYPTWRGHLQAWGLYTEDEYDVDGVTLLHRAGDIKEDAYGNKVGEPFWADGCGGLYAPSSTGDPDAGCIMAEDFVPGLPPDGPLVRRTLYTNLTDDNSGKVLFDPVNAEDLSLLLNPGGDDVNNNGNPGLPLDESILDAKTIINYIHHPGFDNANYVGNRDKNWPLADIYNSGPVLVPKSPVGNCLDLNYDDILDSGSWPTMTGYCDYAESNKNRAGMLYFGTNGGMIEAITAGKLGVANSGGVEVWGYLPKFVLPKLKEMSDGHRFTMDLTILANEVDTSDGLDGSGWRTMLVAGQRKGGSGYIALDVTDPTNPLPMWEFTDVNLGQTWSRPSVARIIIDGTKTSVLIFGGGYDAAADKGDYLYIVKASDGSILKKIQVGATTNDIPSQIQTMYYLTNNVGTVVDYRTNLAKLPDGTDIDYSGRLSFTEVAYFGDTSGNVWRLDGLNSDSGGWNPTIVKLYDPDSDHERPIYYPPVVTDIKKGSINNGVETGCVRRYISIGTGSEDDPIATKKADGSPLIDYFFEIEDDGGSDVNDESNLNWRFFLGMQLPSEYGFLLKPDKTRAKKDGKDVLSKYIYIMDAAVYNDAESLWSIDSNNHLLDNGKIAALSGEYLFSDSGVLGNLYTDPLLTSPLVAAVGTYTQVDFALWLNDAYGQFYDSEDGTVLIPDTSLYLYDDDGYWVDSSNARITIAEQNPDSNYTVKLVSDPGEKILAAPVGYGPYIYFTSYTPIGGCATGSSYFYGLQSSTCGLNGGTGILTWALKPKYEFYSAPRRRSGFPGISGGVTLGGGTAYMTGSNPGGDAPEMYTTPTAYGGAQLKFWKQN